VAGDRDPRARLFSAKRLDRVDVRRAPRGPRAGGEGDRRENWYAVAYIVIGAGWPTP